LYSTYAGIRGKCLQPATAEASAASDTQDLSGAQVSVLGDKLWSVSFKTESGYSEANVDLGWGAPFGRQSHAIAKTEIWEVFPLAWNISETPSGGAKALFEMSPKAVVVLDSTPLVALRLGL
jgi:hypothetical protein